MDFENIKPVENQEKELKTIEDWIKFIDPEIKIELVDKIEKKGRESGSIPAAYCFDGENPKFRENERMEIDRKLNETNKSPLNCALHEIRHRRQRNYEAEEKEFGMFTIEQAEDVLKEFGGIPSSLANLLEKIKDSPREIDAILFSLFVQTGIDNKIILKEDIKTLINMDSDKIIDYFRDKLSTFKQSNVS